MKPLLKTLLAIRQMVYLTLDAELRIVAASQDAQQFADADYPLNPTEDCCLSFPELIGMEDQLRAGAQGLRSHCGLHAIARSQADGKLIYFDLWAIGLTESTDEDSAIILLLEDVTYQMELEQRLVQASNEMCLLMDALAASKNHVEKLLTQWQMR